MAKWSEHATERMVERRPYVGVSTMRKLARRATGFNVVTGEEIALAERLCGPHAHSGAAWVVAIIKNGVVVTIKTLSASSMETEQKYKRVLY